VLKTQRVAENVITDLRSVRNMPRATELRAEVGWAAWARVAGRAGGWVGGCLIQLVWVPWCKVW
jgi:hypothetical protein